MKRVLIVDDDAQDLWGPCFLLRQLGVEVTLALDGIQALEELRRNQFDLVLLDWNLPGIDGSQVLSCLDSIRFDSFSQPLRIVLHSGADLEAFMMTSPQFEIVDVWKKPVGAVDFYKRLKRIVL